MCEISCEQIMDVPIPSRLQGDRALSARNQEKHETARKDTLQLLKLSKVSGAGSSLVRHEAAEKASARETPRGLVTTEFLGEVAEEADRRDAGHSRVTCRCGSAGRRLSSSVACR